MSAPTYSLVEASAILGVARQTLARWLAEGCPSVQRANRARGQEWQIRISDVLAWREERAVQQAVGDTAKLDIDEARRRKTAAEAALAELELAKQRGEVVAVEVVAKAVGDQLSACRARLLSLPTKAAPLVAVEADVQVCRDLIEQGVRDALDELVGYGPAGAGGETDDEAPAGDGGADAPAAAADGERVGGSAPAAKRGGKRRARAVEHGAQ